MDPSSSASSQRLPTSSHRLPTVSASQALQGLRARGPRAISTGLNRLDTLLATSNGTTDTQSKGGFKRGVVTEIWGPPGGGKTSLAMQAAAGALSSGNSVVWVDTAAQRVNSRLKDFLAASGVEDQDAGGTTNLKSYFAPTVAHLLALIMHAPSSFPPQNTVLMVVDGLHAVFDIAYPRGRPNTYGSKSDPAKWAAGRRYSVLGSTIAALKKLAALHDMAVLVITGCATRVRTGSGLGAVLVPGLGGAEWESGIANRLVMLRDFAPAAARLSRGFRGSTTVASARLIGLQKVHGRFFGEDGEIGQLIAFRIEKDGLKELEDTPAVTDTTPLALAASSPVKSRKRRHEEITDSDGEGTGIEYGSLDEDAEGLIDAAALNEDDPNAVETLAADA